MELSPGHALLDLVSRADDELLLVAPYVKFGALQRVLDACPEDVSIKVVTRWRAEELALGVSDLEVWPLLQTRGASLWLHASLHAKYYAARGEALIGSANLTDTALGWRPDSNLEILLDASDGRLPAFERELWAGATQVDDGLYNSFKAALAAFPPPPVVSPPSPDLAALFHQWRPVLRHPEELETAYLGGSEFLSTASREAAAADLAALSPPSGLSRVQFRIWVSLQLRQHPEFAAIDRLTAEPRRFGELRALLSKRGARNGARAWQAWMRWLLYFLAEEYQMEVTNYSEVFSRRDTAPSRTRAAS